MLEDSNSGRDALLGFDNSRINNNKPAAPSLSNTKSSPNANNEVIEPRGSTKESTSKSDKKKKDKNDTQFTAVLKFLNVIIGLGVIAFGGACYKFFDEDTKQLSYMGIILPGYIAFSGFLILLIECNIGFIVRNMKFLYNFIGRGLFNIYVGVMPLSLIRNGEGDKQNQIFQVIIYIIVSLMCLVGVLYILAKILCCAKEENKTRRKNSSDQQDSD